MPFSFPRAYLMQKHSRLLNLSIASFPARPLRSHLVGWVAVRAPPWGSCRVRRRRWARACRPWCTSARRPPALSPRSPTPPWRATPGPARGPPPVVIGKANGNDGWIKHETTANGFNCLLKLSFAVKGESTLNRSISNFAKCKRNQSFYHSLSID